MNKIAEMLMGGTTLGNRTTFSGEGFNGGYSGNADDDQFDDGQQDGGFEDGNEITGDTPDALDSLYAPDPDATEEGEEEFDLNAGFPTQEELTTEITNNIANFSLAEDLIPDDFNPNDPRQMREVLANAQRAGIQSAIGTMFRPVQVAMEQMQREVNRRIDQTVQNNNTNQTEQQILSKTIPAIDDPTLRDVVQTVYKQAKLKHKTPQAAATAAKTALLAMGVNPNGRKAEKQSVASGRAVLDAYAPLPKPTRRPTQDVRNNLRRT